jgi:hypothetical protein
LDFLERFRHSLRKVNRERPSIALRIRHG